MNPTELLRLNYPVRFPDKPPVRLNNRKFLRIFDY